MKPLPVPIPKTPASSPQTEPSSAETLKQPATEKLIQTHRDQIVGIDSRALKEAEKRGLEAEQWIALEKMARILYPNATPEWIDAQFQYENGKIHVDGGLKFLNKPGLFRLPDNLKIEGDLRITGAMLRTLPKGLVVTQTLWVDGCDQFEEFPDDIKLGGPLLANHNPKLRHIPPLFQSNASFVDCASLAELPEGLTMKGFATFDQCPLTHLPAGMKAQNLSLVGCPLEDLPDDLIVEGSLALSNNVSKAVRKKAEELQKRAQTRKGESLPQNGYITGRIEFR